MNFNTRYGLTDATIERRKRETRRNEFTEEEQHTLRILSTPGVFKKLHKPHIFRGRVVLFNDESEVVFEKPTRYKIGEIVAVAQSYDDAGINPAYIVSHKKDGTPVAAIQSPGWNNKMFTRADLMPHQIRITGIRIERLQDIADESCLREGIEFHHGAQSYYVDYRKQTGYMAWLGRTPREAFAALIDKVSGRGTWESNPYVVVYEFELVK